MIADNLVALVCKNIYINLSKYSQTHTKTFVNDSVVIVLKGLEDFSANPVTLRGNILRMR